MAKYLITSSCLYLGHALYSYLIERGDSITYLKLENLEVKEEHVSKSNINIIEIDQLAKVEKYMKDVDGCFHITKTQPSNILQDISPQQYMSNMQACISIFNMAAKYGTPLVFSSSATVYGNNVEYPLSEHSITRPTSMLGANMLAIEQYARTLSISKKQKVTALRLFDVYGGQAKNNRVTRNLLNQLKQKIFKHDRLIIKEALHSVYDFIHIDDTVRGFASAMDNVSSPFQIFNLCSGESVTGVQIVNSVLNIKNEKNKVTLLHKGYTPNCLSAGDNKLSKKILNFEPNINLIEGLTSLYRPLFPLS